MTFGEKVGLYSLIVAIISAVIAVCQLTKKPDVLVVNESPLDRSAIELSLVNPSDGTPIVISGTNMWSEVGTNGCEVIADFGITNQAEKVVKNVKLVSNTVTIRDGVALDNLAIPFQESPTNAYVLWSANGTVTGEVFNVHFTSKLDQLIRKAKSDFMLMRFTNALSTAKQAWNVYGELLEEANGKNMRFDNELTAALVRLLPILIDGALYEGDYSEVERLANQYDEFCIGTTMYARAMRDIAQLKKEGGRLLFFTPKQLRELRSFDKEQLREYLNILAIRGYLQPIELDASRKGYHPISYEEYFELGDRILYVKSVKGVAKGESGESLMSSCVSGQWCGMGKVVNINHDEAAEIALGIQEEGRVQNPLQLFVEYRGTRWCGVEPTGVVRGRRVKIEPKLTDYISEIIKDGSLEDAAENAGFGAEGREGARAVGN